MLWVSGHSSIVMTWGVPGRGVSVRFLDQAKPSKTFVGTTQFTNEIRPNGDVSPSVRARPISLGVDINPYMDLKCPLLV
jgi:hypothetical protein